MIKPGLFSLLLLCITTCCYAQDPYQATRAQWLAKAQQLMPQLNETIKRPVSTVALVKDEGAFQGWAAKKTDSLDIFYASSFRQKKSIILDFSEHLTGYVSFGLKVLTGTADAPARFKLTFGEVPSEIATPFDPYTGGLSRAWLQDEVATVMDIPSTVSIARRVAFRYIKIELTGSSQNFDFAIGDIQCKAVTSVTNIPAPLSTATASGIRAIDSIGLATLKECMQTVYEDGPKRDRRLWIGDLYLESLANSYSFKNHDLTKRCLYLLAGLSGEKGYLIGTVFEKPEPHPQANQYLMDYALLYNSALKEYLTATNDTETANDLWPVAKRQLDIIRTYLQPNGMMDYERANKEWWLFFDWKDGLDREAALQGLAIYTLKQTYSLAKALHKEQELADVPSLIKKMSAAAQSNLYDAKSGLVYSGKARQVSYASQIWLVLSGVLSDKESKQVLLNVAKRKDALYPGAPYLYHYYVHALINAGLNAEAKATVLNYWGGMVKKGADTFWEVYDPNNQYLSPYGFFPINSYCHAWSCTPVYFIRKYPEIFQKQD
ncbi:alpha-L-rhamnosidase-related protein [Mucilaginibacter psychrotolerans]|uniref:Glycoside hydrolase n=1 Tax=Mucilaginibacter psychrotolerans TaxID=1524096 RepID=A0A4Y8SHZ1_9SPHI|nr:family 78 glycoside hydrolase catalytic domain [Mucilaginibacter psychrotolerans]TFF38016.1 glycoside hydrolase [Mucilaginibacter psychrotolerans]